MKSLPVMRPMLMDEYQQKVIEAPDGVFVVDAIAGSGKTACLTNRIVNLIDHGVKPSQITMVTFTRKAAKEMLDRVTNALGDTFAGETVNSGTFHALVTRFLKDFYYIRGERFHIIKEADEARMLEMQIEAHLRKSHPKVNDEDWTEKQEKRYFSVFDAKKLIKGLASATSYCFVDQEHKTVSLNYRKSLSVIKHSKNKAGAMLEMTPEEDELAFSYMKAFYKYKRRNSYYNYDDILIRFYESLTHDEGFRKYVQMKAKHLLVDEYQDVNELQYNIVYEMQTGSLMAIGDKAQAIYAFRGSKATYIEKFKKFFSAFDPKSYVIKKNYRSDETVLKKAEKLIQNNFSDMELIPTVHGKGSVSIKRYHNRMAEAEAIMQAIKDNYDRGIPYAEQSILIRGRNILPPLEYFARKMEIPYTTSGVGSFLDSIPIRESLSFLKLVEYRDKPYFYYDVLMLYPGLGEKRAKDICMSFESSGKCDLMAVAKGTRYAAVKSACIRLFGLLSFIDKLQESYKNEDVVAIEEQLESLSKDAIEERKLLLSLKEGMIQKNSNYFYDVYRAFDTYLYSETIKQRATSRKGVIDDEMMLYYDRQMRLFGELVSATNNLDDFLSSMMLNVEDPESDDDADKVEINTMHSSKGLEWNVVFCPSWNDGIFPSAVDRDNLQDAASWNKMLADERNLAYVSLTRARRELFISYCQEAVNDRKALIPSSFLYESNLLDGGVSLQW